MRKHRRTVLRHLRTAEFHKLSKLGRKVLAECEALDEEFGVTVYTIENEEDRQHMLACITSVFDEVINEKSNRRAGVRKICKATS